MFSVTDHLGNTLHRGQNSTSAQHVQLVTELVQMYRLRIFNKLEVSRLDSTLSVFVIIRTYKLYHGVRLVVRIKLLPRPWEQNFDSALNSSH